MVDDKTLLAQYKAEIDRLTGLLAEGGGGAPGLQEELESERQKSSSAEARQKQLQAQIEFMQSQVIVGLGRIFALYYCSSALYKIH